MRRFLSPRLRSLWASRRCCGDVVGFLPLLLVLLVHVTSGGGFLTVRLYIQSGLCVNSFPYPSLKPGLECEVCFDFVND